MSGELLLAFWGVSLLLVMTPGMDWAYVISAGIRGRGVVLAQHLARLNTADRSMLLELIEKLSDRLADPIG